MLLSSPVVASNSDAESREGLNAISVTCLVREDDLCECLKSKSWLFGPTTRISDKFLRES